jgi:magnesium-transporting ATPase (P-type)
MSGVLAFALLLALIGWCEGLVEQGKLWAKAVPFIAFWYLALVYYNYKSIQHHKKNIILWLTYFAFNALGLTIIFILTVYKILPPPSNAADLRWLVLMIANGALTVVGWNKVRK